jgi:hypothetical protein
VTDRERSSRKLSSRVSSDRNRRFDPEHRATRNCIASPATVSYLAFGGLDRL